MTTGHSLFPTVRGNLAVRCSSQISANQRTHTQQAAGSQGQGDAATRAQGSVPEGPGPLPAPCASPAAVQRPSPGRGSATGRAHHQPPFAVMPCRERRSMSAHTQDAEGAGRRACELASPAVRRHPLRWWTEPLPVCSAPAEEHAGGAGAAAQRSLATASMRASPRSTPGRPATNHARRPYPLDWGCGRRYLVLAVTALAAATALPRAEGYLKTYSTWCGDGICEPRLENRGWCPRDCLCGDGVCDDEEAVAASCPQDCIKQADIVAQPSPESKAGVAFGRQPAVHLSDIAQLDAYTPGERPLSSVVPRCCEDDAVET